MKSLKRVPSDRRTRICMITAVKLYDGRAHSAHAGIRSMRLETAKIIKVDRSMANKIESKSRSAKKHTPARQHSQAQRAVAKHAAPKAELQYIPWRQIPLEDLNPLLQRQFVVGQEIMIARVLLKKGCIVPEHSHHNEQLTYILDGALKFFIDGKEIVVHSGEVLCIPANMPHKAEAMEDTVDLDVFNPPRLDWINRTDQYLRAAK